MFGNPDFRINGRAESPAFRRPVFPDDPVDFGGRRCTAVDFGFILTTTPSRIVLRTPQRRPGPVDQRRTAVTLDHRKRRDHFAEGVVAGPFDGLVFEEFPARLLVHPPAGEQGFARLEGVLAESQITGRRAIFAFTIAKSAESLR